MTRFNISPSRSAGHLIETKAKSLGRAWLARPFGAASGPRVLIYYKSTAICWSQVYPFAYYEAQFKARYGCAIRFRPISDFLTKKPGPEADIILVQPWFTEDGMMLAEAFESMVERQPKAQISFLDSFAHNDLRLGAIVEPYITHYFKKSLFKDRQTYLRDFRGDTNLTEFYGDLYGVGQGDPVSWSIPKTLLDRLQLSPSFFTAPRFMTGFRAFGPAKQVRGIDVQSRLGLKGTPWYTAMRQDAQRRIEQIDGISLSPPGKLSLSKFTAELENSKLCFSPFGYGELCWRDVEAFQAGSVVIKPDMGHLETHPELYEAGETYLPVRWDFEDLEDVVAQALADDAGRDRIARQAYHRVKSYIENASFVSDMALLFRD